MPGYWWVNHKQTSRQEIEGQYLWSPKVEANGVRSEFYNNMRRATPGDLILSYADQEIRYVGRVAEFAFTAPKPEEFGGTGAYWSDEGWFLPVYWTPLDPPVRPKAQMAELRLHLPERYSPINARTGGGNQKAYLAQVPKAVFDIVLSGSTYDRTGLKHGGSNSLSFDVVTEILDDAVQRRLAVDISLDDTVRSSVIQARRGQGVFRANVEGIESVCRLTGITSPSLLAAGHIKPWRSCKSAAERLDGNNGLLLTPDADHLFDRGYISFTDEGDVLVSPRVDPFDLRRLGFDQLVRDRFGPSETPATWRTGAFNFGQSQYLDYHRSEVFIS